jgi:hypothetical protein
MERCALCRKTAPSGTFDIYRTLNGQPFGLRLGRFVFVCDECKPRVPELNLVYYLPAGYVIPEEEINGIDKDLFYNPWRADELLALDSSAEDFLARALKTMKEAGNE